MRAAAPASLVLLAALAACATAAQAPHHRLEFLGSRIFVPALVNGSWTNALLDSGAEMTILDDDLARRMEIPLSGGEQAKGTGGTVEARFASGVDVAAFGILLEDRDAAVIDLADVSNRLVGRPVELILGREFFDSGRIRIDIQAGEIGLVGRGAEPRGARLPLTTRKGIETFPVSVDGLPPVEADFDLGNGSEVLAGKAYARRIGLTVSGRIVDRRAGGGLGGAVERDIVVLKSLRIGDQLFEGVTAAIDPTENAADLNVGAGILQNFIITTDFPQRALWLERKR